MSQHIRICDDTVGIWTICHHCSDIELLPILRSQSLFSAIGRYLAIFEIFLVDRAWSNVRMAKGISPIYLILALQYNNFRFGGHFYFRQLNHY
jgi:hypothetical protein